MNLPRSNSGSRFASASLFSFGFLGCFLGRLVLRFGFVGEGAKFWLSCLTDLKKIYQAASELEAEQELENFSSKWDEKYPTISKQWRWKWPHITSIFELPVPIRKAVYATNAIESVNSAIRKFARNRKQYPNRDSALKLIYMAINEASKKWTKPIRNWIDSLNHFAILFEGRMPKEFT